MKAVKAAHARLMTLIISKNKADNLDNMLNWISLTDLHQLDEIKKQSFVKPQVLFKHSSRCSISSVALRRLDNAGFVPEADYYLLDLFRNRYISAKIADDFNVCHESPQLLLIKEGACVYDESHLSIDMSELAEQLARLN